MHNIKQRLFSLVLTGFVLLSMTGAVYAEAVFTAPRIGDNNNLRLWLMVGGIALVLILLLGIAVVFSTINNHRRKRRK